MVRISRLISILLCCGVLLATTGCAYNSTNPVARYASYGSTYGAVPGVIGLAVAGAAASGDDDDSSNDNDDSAGNLALVSLVLLGAGYVAGGAIGGVVGLIRWMALGDFEPNSQSDEGIPAELYEGTEKVTVDDQKEARQEDSFEKRRTHNWDASPLAQ